MTDTSDLQPAIRVVVMPRDTNPMGTIFGGTILSYIDQAGAVEVRKHSEQKVATVAMHAFLTLLLIPLTQSISCGIGVGFIATVAVKLLSGKGREVSPWFYAISLLFVLHFAL